MEAFSVLLAICAENSSVTKASDAELWCFSDLGRNKRLSKQPWGWWFDTPSGGRLNKKDGLTRYGDSHVKDKTS